MKKKSAAGSSSPHASPRAKPKGKAPAARAAKSGGAAPGAGPVVKYDVEAFVVLSFDGELDRLTIGENGADPQETFLAFPLLSYIPPRMALAYRWWARSTMPSTSDLEAYADEFLVTALSSAYERSSGPLFTGHEWHGGGWASSGSSGSPFTAQAFVLEQDGYPLSITARPTLPGSTTLQTATGRFLLVLQFKP